MAAAERVDAGEELISRRGALPVGLRLSGNQNVARYISFAAIGFTKLTNGGFQAGTLTLCQASERPTAARQVVLNALGRPRVQNQTVSRPLTVCPRGPTVSWLRSKLKTVLRPVSVGCATP